MKESDLRRAILCGRAGRILFGELVTDCSGECMAHLVGWRGMYITPLQAKHQGWSTPARGDLGPGWPDLVLVHGRQQRVIYAELKRDGAQLREDQAAVGVLLGQAGQEHYTWRPADLDDGTIWRILQKP